MHNASVLIRIAAALSAATEPVTSSWVASQALCSEALAHAWLDELSEGAVVVKHGGQAERRAHPTYRLAEPPGAGGHAALLVEIMYRWPQELGGITEQVREYVQSRGEATIPMVAGGCSLPADWARAAVVVLLAHDVLQLPSATIAQLYAHVEELEPDEALPFSVTPAEASRTRHDAAVFSRDPEDWVRDRRLVFGSLAFHAAMAMLRSAPDELDEAGQDVVARLLDRAQEDTLRHPLPAAALGLVRFGRARLAANRGDVPAADRAAQQALLVLSGSHFDDDVDDIIAWLRERPPSQARFPKEVVERAWVQAWPEADDYLKQRMCGERHMALGRLARYVAGYLPGADSDDVLSLPLMPRRAVVCQWSRETADLKLRPMAETRLVDELFAYLLEFRRPAPVIVLGDPVPDHLLAEKLAAEMAAAEAQA